MTAQDQDGIYKARQIISKIRQLSVELIDSFEGSDNAEVELRRGQIRRELALLSGELKIANWDLQGGLGNLKEATNNGKVAGDQKHLAVQNLLYQHKHLKHEISQCERLVSKHESLELVPEKEFLAEHPELEGQSNHEIIMHRLRDEESKRFELFLEQNRLQETRNALHKEVTSLTEDLHKKSDLETEIHKFVQNMEPLRQLIYKH